MQGLIATRFVLLVASLLALNPHPALGQRASAPTQDIILLLDNSGSMKKNDPWFVTKEVVRQFVSRTPDSGRLALLLFDQEARLIVPLTRMSNAQRARALSGLDRINYRGLFTNIPAAFEQAIYELKTKGHEDAFKSIILLTDGIVDTGDKGRDLDRTRWLREELAADAARQGITVFGIGLGAKSDIQLLQSLAQRTQGDYFRAATPDDLSMILVRIEQAMAQNLAPPKDLKEATIEKDAAAVDIAVDKVTEPPQTEQMPDAPIDPSPKSAQTTPLPPQRRTPQQPEEQPDGKPDFDLRIVGVGAAALLLVALVFSLATRRRKHPASETGATMGPVSVDRIPTAYLYDINGITDYERYRLNGRVTQVGRIPPDQRETVEHIVIPLPTVGRRHAVLEYKHHSFWLIDQKSVNGTFVNGQRVFDDVCLKHGDRIRFHEAEFEFVQEGMDRADQTLLVTRVKGALTGPDTRFDHEPVVSRWVSDFTPETFSDRPVAHTQTNEESPAEHARDQENDQKFAEDLASKVRLATADSVTEVSPKREAATDPMDPSDSTEHGHTGKTKAAIESTEKENRSEALEIIEDAGVPDGEAPTRRIKRTATDEGDFDETRPSKRTAKNSWKDFFGE